MVAGIINQAVVGKHNAFRAAIPAGAVDVTFMVFPSVRLRQPAFIIAKIIAADALAGGNLGEITLLVIPIHPIDIIL